MSTPLPKILAVDDIADNRVAMKRVLSSVKAEIVTATLGTEALSLCLKHHFALILLDVHMPEMDGYEVAIRLRELDQTKDVPIIFVTATYFDELHRLKGYDVGAVDYITKPVNDHILLSKVNIFLDLYNQKQALKQEIIERKQVEEALQQAKRTAEAANKAKSRFLATMSHEIRTPMNGVLGMAQLLSHTQMNAQQRSHLNTILSAANNLLKIINDILDFSKMDEGKITLEKIPFVLDTELRETVDLMSRLAEHKKLALLCSIMPGIPSVLVGDAHRLRQILFNLIGNAIKFTEQGNVELSVDLKKESETHARLRFTVTDTGVGFPMEEQKRLFHAFEQADGSTTRTHGGTGLGLAIASQLVRLMGGAIEVSSTPGKGTIFSFALDFSKGTMPEQPTIAFVPKKSSTFSEPGNQKTVIKADQTLKTSLNASVETSTNTLDREGLADLRKVVAFGNRAKTEDAHEHELFPGMEAIDHVRGARILVVEDNIINQEVIRGILERVGVTVEIAENGEEAVDKVAHSKFDAVLMDLKMPKMDGYTATRHIRDNPRNQRLPIIAMTAHVLSEEREKCLKAGMNGHVGKPIDLEQLYTVLAQWVQLKPHSIAEENENHADPLPEVTGINIQSGLMRMGGDRETYLKLLGQFCHNHADDAKKIKGALADGDMTSVKQSVHLIKGLSGNIGATRLHHSARTLEGAIRSGHEEEQTIAMVDFASALHEVVASIKQLETLPSFTDQPPESVGKADSVEVVRLLTELSGRLEAHDPDIELWMDGLREQLHDTQAAKAFTELENYTEKYHFENALDVVQIIAGFFNLEIKK